MNVNEFEDQNDEYSEDAEMLDDVEMEDLDDEGENLTPNNQLTKIRKKLKACEKESREHLDGWQRAKADMVNMRQGHIDDLKRAEERGREKLLEAVAPVLDSFDMAMQGDAWQNVDQNWRTGVEGIHAQLLGALSAHGLQVIDPTGEQFNPHEHESVSMEHTDDDAQDNVVTQTLQKGLKLGERVVRPAKVVVATKQ